MSNSNDISQIRNLIFGEELDKINAQFKQFDARFKQVEQLLDQITNRIHENKSHAQQLEESINTAENALKEQVDALKNDIIDRLEKLQSEKTARDELAVMFTDLANRLNNSSDK